MKRTKWSPGDKCWVEIPKPLLATVVYPGVVKSVCGRKILVYLPDHQVDDTDMLSFRANELWPRWDD